MGQRKKTEPNYEDVERGGGALVPFVKAWGLSLNPEELDEMAYAVLKHCKHSNSKAAWEKVEREVKEQIAEFERRNKEMQEAWSEDIRQRLSTEAPAAK